MSFESKLDLLSTQLIEVLNENKSLRKKVKQIKVKYRTLRYYCLRKSIF